MSLREWPEDAPSRSDLMWEEFMDNAEGRFLVWCREMQRDPEETESSVLYEEVFEDWHAHG